MQHPSLIIVRGIPGSGKSYLARALAHTLGEVMTVLLDPDSIDTTSPEFQTFSRQLTAEGVDEKFHLFRYSRQHAFDGILAGKILIWNQAFNNFNGLSITIDRLLEFAKDHATTLPVLIVEVEVDPALAKQRIAARVAGNGHAVSDAKLDEFVANYTSFADKGYPTMRVQGEDNTDGSVRSIIDSLATHSTAT